MIYFSMLIFTFIVFAFFMLFESFIAEEGKFKKTKVLLRVLLLASWVSLLIGFVLINVYAHYTREHYHRGIIKIGNLIKSGYTKEAAKAIDRFAKEPVKEDIFSLDDSLAIHRIIDEVIKEENLNPGRDDTIVAPGYSNPGK